jgi:hypothetical protein
MIRRISSLALGIAVSFAAMNALAQEEGGDEAGGGEPAAGGDEAAPAEGGGEEAAPTEGSEGGGEAAASGEASASSEGVPDTGGKIKVGLRVGYGLPMGEIAKDVKMSDAYSGMIPIWLDLGYMVTPNIMVGLYGQYGIMMLSSDAKDGCDALNVDCSASDIRFGLQGQYHLSPGESMNPWFGLGIGMEMVNAKVGDAKAGYSGLEFANLQGGLDFKAGPLDVGPFVSFSLGQYSKTTGDNSADIKDKGMHQWLVLGIKGTMGF